MRLNYRGLMEGIEAKMSWEPVWRRYPRTPLFNKNNLVEDPVSRTGEFHRKINPANTFKSMFLFPCS
jgi:hypothetical protein